MKKKNVKTIKVATKSTRGACINITVAFRTNPTVQKAIGLFAKQKGLRKSQVINSALAKALKIKDTFTVSR